jgi:hypothetical protein
VGGSILQQLSSLGCEFQLVKKTTIKPTKFHKSFPKKKGIEFVYYFSRKFTTISFNTFLKIIPKYIIDA